MIGRALGIVALVTSAAVAAPWIHPADADGLAPVAAPREASSPASPDPLARVHAAVEEATARHIPGALGSGWVLHRLEQSDPALDGTTRIVASGIIAAPGGPGTNVRLTGRYDDASGQLDRVSYRLHTPAARQHGRPGSEGEASWSVQSAVRQALADAAAEPGLQFALDSAQSLRLEDGGRRFEGHGIGLWQDGEPRFVTFTLQLSADGQPVAFDYGTQEPATLTPVLADN